MSFGGSWIAGFRLSKVLESGCWGSRKIGVQVRLENAASQRLKNERHVTPEWELQANFWLPYANYLKKQGIACGDV